MRRTSTPSTEVSVFIDDCTQRSATCYGGNGKTTHLSVHLRQAIERKYEHGLRNFFLEIMRTTRVYGGISGLHILWTCSSDEDKAILPRSKRRGYQWQARPSLFPSTISHVLEEWHIARKWKRTSGDTKTILSFIFGMRVGDFAEGTSFIRSCSARVL